MTQKFSIICNFNIFKLETLSYLTNLKIRERKSVIKTIHFAKRERGRTSKKARKTRELRSKCTNAYTKRHAPPTKRQYWNSTFRKANSASIFCINVPPFFLVYSKSWIFLSNSLFQDDWILLCLRKKIGTINLNYSQSNGTHSSTTRQIAAHEICSGSGDWVILF